MEVLQGYLRDADMFRDHRATEVHEGIHTPRAMALS
jgi:hypothetical protein